MQARLRRIFSRPVASLGVGVTRGGSDGCHYFLEKQSDDLFSHRLWKWWLFSVVSSLKIFFMHESIVFCSACTMSSLRKFTFAISSPDEFPVIPRERPFTQKNRLIFDEVQAYQKCAIFWEPPCRHFQPKKNQFKTKEQRSWKRRKYTNTNIKSSVLSSSRTIGRNMKTAAGPRCRDAVGVAGEIRDGVG